MKKIKAIIIVLTIVCCACRSEAAGLAVKRGQEHVDASKLPFVCIAFGTANIGMPIHAVTVIGLQDSKKRRFVVSKSFGNDHPDYLTALAGETMLCLVTLSLPAGEYQLDSIEYTGGKSDDLDYTFSFSQNKKLKFAVVPDAVNFVGSVEFSAPWMPRRIPARSSAIHPVEIKQQLPTTLYVRESAARDCKWVNDQIPGLRGLKACLSHLEDLGTAEK